MARINQDLIERLQKELGFGPNAIYARINKIVNETAMERPQAALLLGMREGINVNKYSTPAERAEVRGWLGGGGSRWDPDDNREVAPGASAARRAAPSKSKPAKKKKRRSKDNTVFVVHGRDDALRRSMFEFLRTLGLAPQEWQQALASAKGNNPYVGSVIDEVMDQAQAVVVMLSPDDWVRLKEQFCSKDEMRSQGREQGQARPNVLFEAGMAMARHAEKTVMVRVGRVKAFSDVFGRHIPELGDDFDSRNDFANRLAKAGCIVNRVGTDWAKAGTLTPTEPKPAKRKK